MPEIKNILLIRFKSIGDVVLTLPAVHVVRENFPAAKITFLTSRENAALLEGFREVNDVIMLDRAALRGPNPLRIAGGFFGLLHRLRAGKFDLAVDFQGYGETAWLARITGAAQRWGCVHKNSRRWAYTIACPRAEKMHPAAGYLQLLKDCGLKIGPVQNQFHLPSCRAGRRAAIFCGTENQSRTACFIFAAVHQFAAQRLAAGKFSGGGAAFPGARRGGDFWRRPVGPRPAEAGAGRRFPHCGRTAGAGDGQLDETFPVDYWR